MRRHFYLSEDLDDLETLEQDLESQGIERPQIHILSNNDAGLEAHHLHQVESIFRKDVVHSTKIGFIVGIFVAAIPLIAAYAIGVAEGYLWIPIVFLSLILLGFCTWEGGLIGIHRPNHHYKKFEQAIRDGKHLLIVDVTPEQETLLSDIVAAHPSLKDAGLGAPTSDWLVGAQKQWGKFIQWAP